MSNNYLNKIDNLFKPFNKQLKIKQITKNDFLDYLLDKNKQSNLSKYRIFHIGNRYITFIKK